ncbi:MAG: SpoIIE family protein phosphatase, partial [Prochlorothrix sp.]
MIPTVPGPSPAQQYLPPLTATPGTIVTLSPHPDLSPEACLAPPSATVRGIITDQTPIGCGVICVGIARWGLGQYWWLSDGEEPPVLAQIIWLKMLDNQVLRLGFAYCGDLQGNLAPLPYRNAKNCPPDLQALDYPTTLRLTPNDFPRRDAPRDRGVVTDELDRTAGNSGADNPAASNSAVSNSALDNPEMSAAVDDPVSATAGIIPPEYLDIINASPLFEGVDPALLSALLPQCSFRFFRAGETLIRAGYHNHHLHLLLSGYLRVSFMNLPNSYFNQDLGLTITPGECLGEMSIIEHRPVAAYVVAETDGYLLQIPSHLFWERLMHIPRLTQNLLKELSSRIRRSDAVIFNDLEQRFQFEQIEKDLRFASEVQRNILPHFPALPHHPTIEVYAQIQPAREVGGDFFDVFELDQRRVCIAVGDVSGKGVPAALFMIRSITLLRLMMSPAKALDTVLAKINWHLCQNNETSMFLTLFVGILDTETGELTYGNGGHIPPLLQSVESGIGSGIGSGTVGQGGPMMGDWQPIPLPPGILLGINEENRYKLATLRLQPGETLVAYTDGVTEAENDRQEFFGLERTIATLQQLPPQTDVETIVKTLKMAVTHFAGNTPQSDDLTLLALRFNP